MDWYNFLESLKGDVYPEAPSSVHDQITEAVITQYKDRLPAGTRVLDVGCGQGCALQRFKQLGLEAVGITTGEEDLNACRSQGFNVEGVDMHDIYSAFSPGSFDFVWARHVLEHSPAPLFVLRQLRDVLTSDGVMYVEVPAPDTSAHHENNPNHYSVFGSSAWAALFRRAGFLVRAATKFDLNPICGPDAYFGFSLQKRTPDESTPAEVFAESASPSQR